MKTSDPLPPQPCAACHELIADGCQQTHEHSAYVGCYDVQDSRKLPCGCYAHKECQKAGLACREHVLKVLESSASGRSDMTAPAVKFGVAAAKHMHIRAQSREYLVGYIDGTIMAFKGAVDADDDGSATYLTLTCCCGAKYAWQRDEIPSTSTRCSCGCELIRYEPLP